MTTAQPFSIARCTEVERLPELLALLYRAFDGLDPPSGVLKETLDDLSARLGRETFLVATAAGGGIVGSVFYARKGDERYLTRMAVLPAWRGCGVGRALLAAAEGEARRGGKERLALRVRQNLPGNRLYFERRGFTVTGKGRDPGRPPYYVMEGPMLSMRGGAEG